MRIKILSVDKFLKHDLINRSSFESSPSFSDFDAIIIDPGPLSFSLLRSPSTHLNDGSYFTDCNRDGGYGKNLIARFEKRKNEIEKLLEISQGILICYLRKKRESLILKTKRGFKYLDCYSWLPDYSGEDMTISISSSVHIKEQEGTEISFIKQLHPFSKYFYAFKDKIRFESILEIREPLSEYTKIIAENKVQENISCEININGGKIILIPPLMLDNPEIEAGVLLSCIGEIMEFGYESPLPSWVKEYSLPNETEDVEIIVQLDEEIKRLNLEKQKYEDKQKYISKFKGLLYEKGKRALEPLVRDAFRLIGFKVFEPEEYTEEYDLYIKENEITIIGEIEGKDNSPLDVDKYRQLLDYIEQESTKGVSCKGILIGNAFKDIDPAERKNQFSSHAIKGCERQKFCMITTHQLFDIVKKSFSGITNTEMEKIKKNIISCEKEFSLD